MVKAELESMFPAVFFLDPGAYCADILKQGVAAQKRKLSVRVSGDVVSKQRAVEFAESYLEYDFID